MQKEYEALLNDMNNNVLLITSLTDENALLHNQLETKDMELENIKNSMTELLNEKESLLKELQQRKEGQPANDVPSDQPNEIEELKSKIKEQSSDIYKYQKIIEKLSDENEKLRMNEQQKNDLIEPKPEPEPASEPHPDPSMHSPENDYHDLYKLLESINNEIHNQLNSNTMLNQSLAQLIADLETEKQIEIKNQDYKSLDDESENSTFSFLHYGKQFKEEFEKNKRNNENSLYIVHITRNELNTIKKEFIKACDSFKQYYELYYHENERLTETNEQFQNACKQIKERMISNDSSYLYQLQVYQSLFNTMLSITNKYLFSLIEDQSKEESTILQDVCSFY